MTSGPFSGKSDMSDWTEPFVSDLFLNYRGLFLKKVISLVATKCPKSVILKYT